MINLATGVPERRGERGHTAAVELHRTLELDEVERVARGERLAVSLLSGVETVDVRLVVLRVVNCPRGRVRQGDRGKDQGVSTSGKKQAVRARDGRVMISLEIEGSSA